MEERDVDGGSGSYAVERRVFAHCGGGGDDDDEHYSTVDVICTIPLTGWRRILGDGEQE